MPVAKRRAQAMQKMEKLRKKGVNIQPVRIAGRQIANTFWGQAWCEHLEKFSDYENRLPRGRTYVRNGSVCHLDIAKGRIAAKVSGSEIYDIRIAIKPLPKAKWQRVKDSCVGQVGSLLELLQGRLSDHVMAAVTDKNKGLFPHPGEISLDCSCPDWADMCKHVAAVLYGIGARLDEKPELLFVLRGVDHKELVTEDAAKAVVSKAKKTDRRTLNESELSEVFGIDVAPVSSAKVTKNAVRPVTAAKRQDRSTARDNCQENSKRHLCCSVDTRPAGPANRRSIPSSQGLKRRSVSSTSGKRTKAKGTGRKKPQDR